MALEERSVVDKVEVLLNGTIQIRRRDQILRDGEEVTATYHRHVISPGDNLDSEDPRVVAIANSVWTPEVIQEFQQSQSVASPFALE